MKIMISMGQEALSKCLKNSLIILSWVFLIIALQKHLQLFILTGNSSKFLECMESKSKHPFPDLTFINMGLSDRAWLSST